MSQLPPYLTPRELEGITALKRPSAQARWLGTIGIHSARRPDGSVLVLREHFVSVMSGLRHTSPKRSREPDFGSLK